jgi:putative ABC transport system permease protein
MSDRWTQFAESLIGDIRYALRGLRNAPGYAITAVLTLALGLGAVTAMLAVVDSVLLRPVALPHPEQLMNVGAVGSNGGGGQFTFAQLDTLGRETSGIQALASYGTLPAPITVKGDSRIAGAIDTSPKFFLLLGVHAAQGRTFEPRDKGANVAVVSEGFWRRDMHSDPHAVGSSITFGKRLLTVIGILPNGFSFRSMSYGAPFICFPHEISSQGKNDGDMFGGVGDAVVRLKPGVSAAQAQTAMQAVALHAFPGANPKLRPMLYSYNASVTETEQPALLALLGACVLLLLIACANTANLQAMRSMARRNEMGVRGALGASRTRLLRQIATESICVSILGAVCGLAIAYGAVALLRIEFAGRFARFNELALRPEIFGICALLAIAAGLLAAVAPYVSAMHAVTEFSAQGARTIARSRLSGALIVLEIAMTCVLLITAGLLLRTFRALEDAPLHFNPQGVTSVVLMGNPSAGSGTAAMETYTALLQRLRSMPGVQSVGAATTVPFSDFKIGMTTTFTMPGRPQNKKDEMSVDIMSAGYLRTLGASLRKGRNFSHSDGEGAPQVCIVNEAFVRRYLQGRHVLGSMLTVGDPHYRPNDNPFQSPLRIIGVAPNIAEGAATSVIFPTVFTNYEQFPGTDEFKTMIFGFAPQFVVRSSLPQDALEREIRTAIKQAAPGLAEMSIAPLDTAIEQSMQEQKLAMRLAAGFGLMALLLAAVGIYGVLAYSVAQRTREIGIRMALGSSRAGAMRLVARQAAVMVLVGLGLGFAGAWPAGRAVRSFLYGVHAQDTLTLVLTGCVLLAVCAIAAAVPAWRAAQVDPMEALRTE